MRVNELLLAMRQMANPLEYARQLSGEKVIWPLQEPSGVVARAWNDALALGRDVVINGDFASDTVWTKGANWAIAAGVATHTAGAVETLKQTGIAATGKTWKVVFTVSGRTAGTITPKIGVTGTARSSNDTYTENIAATGADLEFVPSSDFDGSLDNVSLQLVNIQASSAYSGDTNPLNGDNNGATVGQTLGLRGIPFAYSFDNNDYVDAYSVELNSFFNPLEGTLLLPMQIANAGVWTDGVNRRLVILQVDESNKIQILRFGNNNILLEYLAGGVGSSYTYASGGSLDQILLAISWNVDNDQVHIDVNGDRKTTLTGLGTWLGNLVATNCVFGAVNNSGGVGWKGLLVSIVLSRREWTETEHIKFAQLLGMYNP
jgi:hypothetical protein